MLSYRIYGSASRGLSVLPAPSHIWARGLAGNRQCQATMIRKCVKGHTHLGGEIGGSELFRYQAWLSLSGLLDTNEIFCALTRNRVLFFTFGFQMCVLVNIIKLQRANPVTKQNLSPAMEGVLCQPEYGVEESCTRQQSITLIILHMPGSKISR